MTLYEFHQFSNCKIATGQAQVNLGQMYLLRKAITAWHTTDQIEQSQLLPVSSQATGPKSKPLQIKKYDLSCCSLQKVSHSNLKYGSCVKIK